MVNGLHHVGVSVADLDRALAFWEPFLGTPPRWRRILDAPYLGEIVGYPGIRMDGAMFDLPGGVVLELLAYQDVGAEQNDPATARPGNVHICLGCEDVESDWRRAVELGAQPVAPQGPIRISAGPNEGAKGAYLRIHDGVSLELFQKPEGAR